LLADLSSNGSWLAILIEDETSPSLEVWNTSDGTRMLSCSALGAASLSGELLLLWKQGDSNRKTFVALEPIPGQVRYEFADPCLGIHGSWVACSNRDLFVLAGYDSRIPSQFGAWLAQHVKLGGHSRNDMTYQLYKVASGKHVGSFPGGLIGLCATLSADGRLLATDCSEVEETGILIYDLSALRSWWRMLATPLTMTFALVLVNAHLMIAVFWNWVRQK
jgi:hypothetical protein